MRSLRQGGFKQPAEWSAQRACWTAWPYIDYWDVHLEPARAEVDALIRLIASHQAVELVANSPEDAAATRARYRDLDVRVHTIPFGDIWMRDIGPIFLLGRHGLLGATRFKFNGWGEKYILDGDADVGRAVCEARGVDAFESGIVLEGGALDVDGEGTCLTTRQCALNPNRNPGATQESMDAAIGEALGVERVLWLDDGLLNDHTDGHVDTLARFVAPGVVVCMEPAKDDPNREVLETIRTTLGRFRDAAGRRLEVMTIPSPGTVLDDEGEPMPASYANFLIGNGFVAVPTYGVPNDDLAVKRLENVFAGRRVVGLSARAILEGGGAFHCITQQEPLSSHPENAP
ncbi:MAG: agmatine deiminase family protein [Polyangiales bacterium]|nr:agmatine deiminase family protein [Myxococcales bacterium]